MKTLKKELMLHFLRDILAESRRILELKALYRSHNRILASRNERTTIIIESIVWMEFVKFRELQELIELIIDRLKLMQKFILLAMIHHLKGIHKIFFVINERDAVTVHVIDLNNIINKLVLMF